MVIDVDIRTLGRAGVLLGLLLLPPRALPAQSSDDWKDDVREAVLRWGFENAGTDLEDPAVYCIAMPRPGAPEDDEPPPELIARFAESDVPVRPVSECEVLQSTSSDFRERSRHSIVDETGEYGLLFILGSVSRFGDVFAETSVTYIQGGLWGAGWRCEVEDIPAVGWRVRQCHRVADI